MRAFKFSFYFFSLLGILQSCGSPFGTQPNVAEGYRPGNPDNSPDPDPSYPIVELTNSTLSFVSPDQVQKNATDVEAPAISSIAGLSTEFNHRADVVAPDGLTRSDNSQMAIEADPTSACGISCIVKNMYMGFLTYVHGE